jgi:hypothetical protein
MSSLNAPKITRRKMLIGASAVAVAHCSARPLAARSSEWGPVLSLPDARPRAADRHFTSRAVESLIATARNRMHDQALATIFSNCFPNTLDTTVWPGMLDGKPDTYVVTGDIDAMWLRDSSAQLWPYLRLAKQDEPLRELLEGAIRRQARMILLDPYANAFMRDRKSKPLSWAANDRTDHKPGVAERKWEIDSLCYPIRLAHGYWQATGDTRPFDAQWKEAAWTVVRTFRAQQRKTDHGPYSFQRSAPAPSDSVPLSGFGNPARAVGMIYSMFRPSDDACIYPLFVPANLFAVVTLRQLVVMAKRILADDKLAAEADALATEVTQALEQHGRAHHEKHGEIWAYEVDGYGNALMMDDANAPGLLSLAYLGCCRPESQLYQRTRRFTLSPDNPYFFQGKAAEGIGGPHVGLNMVWPISIMMRALTSTDEHEKRQCLRWLRNTTAGTGFMHESFDKEDAGIFTRSWFAWANSLMGELMVENFTLLGS